MSSVKFISVVMLPERRSPKKKEEKETKKELRGRIGHWKYFIFYNSDFYKLDSGNILEAKNKRKEWTLEILHIL